MGKGSKLIHEGFPGHGGTLEKGCCEPDVHTQTACRQLDLAHFHKEKLTLRPFMAHWILSTSFLSPMSLLEVYLDQLGTEYYAMRGIVLLSGPHMAFMLIRS